MANRRILQLMLVLLTFSSCTGQYRDFEPGATAPGSCPTKLAKLSHGAGKSKSESKLKARVERKKAMSRALASLDELTESKKTPVANASLLPSPTSLPLPSPTPKKVLKKLGCGPKTVSARRTPVLSDSDTLFVVKEAGLSLSVMSSVLYGTAKKWKQIAEWNGLSSPYKIYVGQTLVLKEKPQVSPDQLTQRILDLWHAQGGHAGHHHGSTHGAHRVQGSGGHHGPSTDSRAQGTQKE